LIWQPVPISSSLDFSPCHVSASSTQDRLEPPFPASFFIDLGTRFFPAKVSLWITPLVRFPIHTQFPVPLPQLVNSDASARVIFLLPSCPAVSALDCSLCARSSFHESSVRMQQKGAGLQSGFAFATGSIHCLPV
jgi:hypothetical protein